MTTRLYFIDSASLDPFFDPRLIPNIAFDSDMIWDDELTWQKCFGVVAPTIGGGVSVQRYERLELGRPVTLVSRGGFGLLRRETVLKLKAISNQDLQAAGLTPGQANSSLQTEFLLRISEGDTHKDMRVTFRPDVNPVDMKPAGVDQVGLIPGTVFYEGTIHFMICRTDEGIL